ncbi:uncharacterized protein PV09_07013 [Verruconis gallopava]|uniref:MARVEL domain-containing protein n=1 Tax=Verruconis gallopava TaxID=253628 RepID=A0A0D2A4Y8_9PEZI|nr:uncharacterized protein PV09_07013 [Verruconis gallopava]KIW01535.1 hypothetical protein PV09_07013 [Verruconis gallopava]
MAIATYEQVPLGPPSPRATDKHGSPPTPVTPSCEKVELRKWGRPASRRASDELGEDPLERLQRDDLELKRRIRVLKIVSRVTAACLSTAVLVPLAITIHKFLSTRDQYMVVTNESAGGEPVRRTAWATQSETWPTYMYFGIAVVSLVFNSSILIAYLHSIRSANRVATLGTAFSGAVLVLNLVIWAITVALYKRRAEITRDGKHNDLWGWTCSPAAKLLQPAFKEQIDFDRYCNIQAISWYIGLVQVGSLLLTVVLYVLALRRLRSKKAVRQSLSARKNSMVNS